MNKTVVFILTIFLTAGFFNLPAAASDEPSPNSPSAQPSAPAGQAQSPASLDATLKRLEGTWSGSASGVDPDGNPTSWKDRVVAAPFVGGKFLLVKITSPKGGDGKPFEGRGIFTYDATSKEYLMFLINNAGFHGEFHGSRNGDTLVFNYADADGDKVFMTFAIQDDSHYRASLEIQPPGKDRMRIWEDRYIRVSTPSSPPG